MEKHSLLRSDYQQTIDALKNDLVRVTVERDKYRVALNEILRNEVLYLDDAYSMIEIAKEALESEE